MELNDKLATLRKEKEWTQEQLADKLYVSRTAISKWESGRGYPSIDSLKAITKLFGVTIDELLSGDELVSLAEADGREKTIGMRHLIFGLLDCMLALLFFLPFFGQPEGDAVLHVSLLALDTAAYIRAAFISYTSLAALFGVAELGFQNIQLQLWQRSRTAISILISIFGVVLFTASPQQYAATLVFILLIAKGFLLIKQR